MHDDDDDDNTTFRVLMIKMTVVEYSLWYWLYNYEDNINNYYHNGNNADNVSDTNIISDDNDAK